MPTHKEARIVPYSAKQMYDLVADIESYPEFIPWVSKAELYDHGTNSVMADLTIGYNHFSISYTSHVEFKPHEEVSVTYKKGPMKNLENRWKFKALDDTHCEVDFYVDFEFDNPFFKVAMETFFNEAVSIMVGAFEKRAQEVYG